MTMARYLIGVIACTLLGAVSCCDIVSLTFPKDLRIGTASAAYQVEGAWNASDKGENIWDRWSHEHPEHIRDGSNGDVACDSYHKYKEDVQWIKSLGFQFYRFSISWSRVLPTGFTNKISEDGLQYYKNLTAELVANGIEPVVTLYHWDHPQVIEDMGGWTNELIVDWFVDYARVMFEALGDNVKRWITINEPDSFCNGGYADGKNAPGKVIPDNIGRYLCGHNVLKAHAKTFNLFDGQYRKTYEDTMSIVLPAVSYIPADPDDTTSAETAFEFNIGWMAHPIYVGDYPKIMKERIAMVSKAQGYPRSRLPEFSEQWISDIIGTHHYFGMNHYTSRLVAPDLDEENGIYNSDMGLRETVDKDWPGTVADWFYVNPPGFGILLRKIRDEYNNPPVWIMENGYADDGDLNDIDRISYYYEYMREMLIAIKRDGCFIEGYTAWSILDNFEWTGGYSERYGLVSVKFDDDETPRTLKSSTNWWASVNAARKLQPVPRKLKTPHHVNLPWNNKI